MTLRSRCVGNKGRSCPKIYRRARILLADPTKRHMPQRDSTGGNNRVDPERVRVDVIHDAKCCEWFVAMYTNPDPQLKP